MESLISKNLKSVSVKELGKEFNFKAFEPIHTEYSTKYLDEELNELSNQSGFLVEETYYDKKRWYSNPYSKSLNTREFQLFNNLIIYLIELPEIGMMAKFLIPLLTIP